jgi:hypothetical protein
VRINQGLTLALAGAFFLASFCLYHLMIFRVNRFLPPGERLLHSIDLSKGNRLASQYKRLYPRSILYPLTMICATTVLVLALAFVALRLTA